VETRENLSRLFAYDDWANRETLAALQAAGAPPPKALRWMAHIVAVEDLWLSRLLQDGRTVAVWPELSLEECGAQLGGLGERWRELLAELAPDGLARPVSYVNSLGEAWTNTAEDILLHTVMHSVYHRGQIAAELRAAGHTPAATDFILAVRQGLVE
jgi:uncharacterized damage-inducible protein DinB